MSAVAARGELKLERPEPNPGQLQLSASPCNCCLSVADRMKVPRRNRSPGINLYPEWLSQSGGGIAGNSARSRSRSADRGWALSGQHAIRGMYVKRADLHGDGRPMDLWRNIHLESPHIGRDYIATASSWTPGRSRRILVLNETAYVSASLSRAAPAGVAENLLEDSSTTAAVSLRALGIPSHLAQPNGSMGSAEFLVRQFPASEVSKHGLRS